LDYIGTENWQRMELSMKVFTIYARGMQNAAVNGLMFRKGQSVINLNIFKCFPLYRVDENINSRI